MHLSCFKVDEYKKQLNIKGREINKRERKSKKDEDTIRVVSRERDAMEVKLRKMTEQMEYYKGIFETKWVCFQDNALIVEQADQINKTIL